MFLNKSDKKSITSITIYLFQLFSIKGLELELAALFLVAFVNDLFIIL